MVVDEKSTWNVVRLDGTFGSSSPPLPLHKFTTLKKEKRFLMVFLFLDPSTPSFILLTKAHGP
jgi:hypothetical protein